MKIKIEGKEVELKFTYNSFRYMEDLDLGDIGKLETNPFKLIRINEILLLGALNNDPKKQYKFEVVQEYLEGCMEDGTLLKISEDLMGLLEKSSFFQNLQVEEVQEKSKEKVKKE